MYITDSKVINARRCIEEAILHFRPTISDEDLLNLRETIYLKVWKDTSSLNGPSAYFRDYNLYANRKGD